MASKDTIVLKGKGHFIEGLLDGSSAPLPGQIVRITNAALVGDLYTYALWTGSIDGERSEIVVVIEDHLQGKTTSDAYAVSTRFLGYIPAPGDELNVLVADTEDAVAIGDKLIVDNGTGKCLETTGTPESEPFVALEAPGTLSDDTLVHVRYTPN